MLDWEQIAAPLVVAFRYRFQIEARSGKFAPDFPLRISGAIEQHAEIMRSVTPAGGAFGKTVMNDPRLSKPGSRCPP
jgi:hypothetical protein